MYVVVVSLSNSFMISPIDYDLISSRDESVRTKSEQSRRFVTMTTNITRKYATIVDSEIFRGALAPVPTISGHTMDDMDVLTFYFVHFTMHNKLAIPRAPHPLVLLGQLLHTKKRLQGAQLRIPRDPLL